MNLASNEKQRPRLGPVTGAEPIDFSSVGGYQRGMTTTSDDAYNLGSASDGRSIRVGSGKNSMIYNSAVASSAYGQGVHGTRQEREQDLMADFKKHFANRGRQKTPQNHHDFLDVIRHQRESIESNNGALPPYSRRANAQESARAD